MKIHLAQHYGMCFGVRDALRATYNAAKSEAVTVLGQLVHNPQVDRHLKTLGVVASQSGEPASTARVVITAHGVSDRYRHSLREAGHGVIDTTCPLVRKAHEALAGLVREGYHPVVIGQVDHVEVRGLVGDFPGTTVLLSEDEADSIPEFARLGIIAQTTQPLEHVLRVVEAIKQRRPRAALRFLDTVCRPTKLRQSALEALCVNCEVVIVVGGRNSNNTRQLVDKAARLGVKAHHIESADEVQEEWLRGVQNVGVTAGTSTLDETVREVVDRLQSHTVRPIKDQN